MKAAARLFATVLLITIATTIAAPVALAAVEKPAPPAGLKCEYRPNPIGIDVAVPRLSWQVQDARRSAVQSAYQILVSTEPMFAHANSLVWDSGKVNSDQSLHVPYAGKPLTSGTRYHWKVRTWDAAGKPSDYSQPTFWEMGLLDPADWKAKWITSTSPESTQAPVLQGAKWIWNVKADGDNTIARFRRTFQLDAADKVEHAEIHATCDDKFVLYVNGNPLGENGDWKTLCKFQFADKLHPGKNAIVLKCENDKGKAGALLSMRIVLAGGKVIDLQTDDRWITTTAEPANWQMADTDESTWEKAKVVGTYGDGSWSELKMKVGPRRSTCMRREFTVKAEPVRARIYVTGLGAYKLLVNGREITPNILSPGWTDYHHHVQYQTYDVTNVIKAGPNAIGAMLGNAWWSGGLGWGSGDAYSTGNLRLLLQMVVEYADGTRDLVVTDESWKTHLSPITRDSLYHGESYDARLEMPGWANAGFKGDDKWEDVRIAPEADQAKMKVVADQCEPIQITQELTPGWVSETGGAFIFDFNQNAVGWARLKVRNAAPGTKIRLRFGEILDASGKLYRDNLRSAQATDEYICKGGPEEIWEPTFTYHGARFVEITGYPGGKPPMDALTYRVFHTNAPPTGVFACSHALLDLLFSNIVWGQRGNLHSIPTDCPQRDERLGWMGDANVFGATSCWNMQMGAFYTKWMQDIMDSQSPEGWVTDVAPSMVVAGPAAPGWGDACVVTPWNVYQYYGDTRIIEQTYDMMVKWIEYMHANRNQDNGLYEREGYGDWVPVVPSPKKPIGAGYYYYSTKLVSQMAAAIGKQDDAAKYAKRAEEIATAYNKAYWQADKGSYIGDTQSANVLPLYFGITPPELQERALQFIVQDIKKRDYHLSTGFLGTGYSMMVLEKYGQRETAYRLAVQTTCPSWCYMVLQGATTMWERWDSDRMGPDMNSRNHYAFGAVGNWLYTALAGINIDPAQPGFKHVIIRPNLPADLARAGATYASMYGDIRSEWRRTDHGLTLDVTIPANTTGLVCVPLVGKQRPDIAEGGHALLTQGKPAGKVAGLTFVDVRDDFATFKAGAGTYKFVMTGE